MSPRRLRTDSTPLSPRLSSHVNTGVSALSFASSSTMLCMNVPMQMASTLSGFSLAIDCLKCATIFTRSSVAPGAQRCSPSWIGSSFESNRAAAIPLEEISKQSRVIFASADDRQLLSHHHFNRMRRDAERHRQAADDLAIHLCLHALSESARLRSTQERDALHTFGHTTEHHKR